MNIVKDLAYKKGSELSEYESEHCKLDLYLPREQKDFPILVWFYGGGLEINNKDCEEAIDVGRGLVAKGIGVAIPNYRLSPKVKYPEYNKDAAASVAWVYKHIANYNGDPKRIFIGGHSAGGYLAMMIGLDQHYLNDVGMDPGQIAGLIPISGQMFTHTRIRAERGLPSGRVIVDEAAPLYHVRDGLPPTLNICAEHDNPARIEENRVMVAHLKAAGNENARMLVIPDRNHGTVIFNITAKDDTVANTICEFILDRK